MQGMRLKSIKKFRIYLVSYYAICRYRKFRFVDANEAKPGDCVLRVKIMQHFKKIVFIKF